jgi:hypothetical protein
MYYVALMLCVSGTIFASAFCFLFADKAAEYVDKYYECIRAITGDRFGALPSSRHPTLLRTFYL